MEENNALFQYHVLLPKNDTTKSGIKDDPSKYFYNSIKIF